MKILEHLKTINHHKKLVMEGCFKVGLYRQGILHDLTKYTPTEFIQGVRFYQGDRSPNAAEREARGYSKAWLHHKGRNKHHYEYWIDMPSDRTKGFQGMKMPVNYVVEMVMDRIAASKTYKKGDYTDASALEYYLGGKDYMIIHPDTKRLLEGLLRMLADEGEDKTFSYIRRKVLKKKNSF